jgi:protein-arginine deiminase
MHAQMIGGKSFLEYNMGIERRLFGLDHSKPDPESLVGRFISGLGLSLSDIIRVPVLFTERLYPEEKFPRGSGAFSPTLVNLSVVGKTLIMPDPFIPIFKHHLDQVLRDHGVRTVWIDNWWAYHGRDGEVHCGSNERRIPFSRKWWH